MKWLRDEKGQVLALTIFSMTVLMGALGLAIDVGVLFHAKRNMQTAADAAAMAGATELYYYGADTTSVTAKVDAASYAAAKANGVDNTVSGNTVNVTIGVTLPGGDTCSSCVEVQVAVPTPTIFMQTMSRLWTSNNSSNFSSVNVAALAVAGGPGASNNCMWVMDPTDSDTLGIHGAGDINAPGCGVYVNSNNPAALCVTGSAGKSTLADIDVVGGQDTHGGCGGTPGTFPTNTSVPAQTPAIADLVPSNPAANCSSVTDLSSSGGTLSGSVNSGGVEGTYYCYTDSAKTKGSITPVTISGATMGPGIYVFETGVYITGNDTIGVGTGTGTSAQTSAGGGATIVVTGTSSQLNMDTASQVTVWAPNDTYEYNSIAIYQPLSDTQPMLLSFGSSTSIFMGTVYAPGSNVTLHDEGGGGVTATNLVVGEIYVNGVVNLSNYSTYNPNTTPFKFITLVE